MIVAVKILLATVFIAAMGLVRVFANRRALQQRINCDNRDKECDESECSIGCKGELFATDERSLHRAP